MKVIEKDSSLKIETWRKNYIRRPRRRRRQKAVKMKGILGKLSKYFMSLFKNFHAGNTVIDRTS